MNQMSRQTETHENRSNSNTARRIIGVIFGVIEIILGLRLIFKLLGANPDNGFVKAIYGITQFFVGIFEGIFGNVTANESAEAVFEPATLIAIVIVALIAWLVLKLMTPRSSNRVERTEYIGSANPADQQRSDNNQQRSDNNQQRSENSQQRSDNNQQNTDNNQQNYDDNQQNRL